MSTKDIDDVDGMGCGCEGEGKTQIINQNQDLPNDPDRRNLLQKATGLVAGAGVAAASWPFIASMNPSLDVLNKSTTETDVSRIAVGELKTVEWQGKPIFILHRSEAQIAEMRASNGSEIDPEPDENRVQRPEWLVVIGLCTHLGCVPTRKSWGWFCPCHGSRYDNSGRVLKGPAPKNLYLFPYTFISDDKLLLGKDTV